MANMECSTPSTTTAMWFPDTLGYGRVRRAAHGLRFTLAGAVLTAALAVTSESCAAAAGTYRVPPDFDLALKVDLDQYLAAHDMVYARLPERHQDGFMLGNGVMGALACRKRYNQLAFLVSRSDVYSTTAKVFPHRKSIGVFILETLGEIKLEPVEPFRVSLYDGALRGVLRTSLGQVRITTYIHAEQEVLAVRTVSAGEEAVTWRFEGDEDPQVTRVEESEPYALGPMDNDEPLTETAQGIDLFHIGYRERGLAAGNASIGWQTRRTGRQAVSTATIAYNRGGSHDTRAAALAALERFAAQGFDDAFASHQRVWRAFQARRFVSIPDKKLESFYYIQFYKLRSATRPGGNPLDLQGTWFDPQTPWPAMWNNLNLQLNYWITTTGNALELMQPLIDGMVANQDRFASMGREFKDAYALHGVTTMDFQPPGPGDSHVMLYDNLPLEFKQTYKHWWAHLRASPGNFLWLMHDLWLAYRYSLDAALLSEVIYPFMKKGVNLYLDVMTRDPAGVIHLPLMYSPEYNYSRDSNYDLAILRWACRTLLEISRDILELDDPLAPEWQQVVESLADYPYDPQQGFLIGRNVALDDAHRHYSHLLMIYPFYDVNVDQSGALEKIEKSIGHWQSFSQGPYQPHPALVGYSFTGAASLYAAMGDGDRAYTYLKAFLDTDATGRMSRGNTLYYEKGGVTGATLETPLTAAVSLHDMLLQSWGGDVRIFPAVPRVWRDVAFAGLRAEGGFLVSAERREGQLHMLRVRSLGGYAIEHFSECSVGISKPIKLFFVAIVGFISANESIVQPKVVNGPIEIFYGAGS